VGTLLPEPPLKRKKDKERDPVKVQLQGHHGGGINAGGGGKIDLELGFILGRYLRRKREKG